MKDVVLHWTTIQFFVKLPLEDWKITGKYRKLGWQNSNPFEEEINHDKKLQKYLNEVIGNKEKESKIELVGK